MTDEEPQHQDDRQEWKLWPPSPKMQIVLIALAIGLFNLLLLAIWAIALYMR